MSTHPAISNDFDAQALVRSVDSHTKEMDLLSKRLKDLEDKYGSNEKLANTLYEAAETALKMRMLLTKTFTESLKSDDNTIQAVTDLVNKTDRDYIAVSYKRIGFFIWTLITLVAGAALQVLIAKLSK